MASLAFSSTGSSVLARSSALSLVRAPSHLSDGLSELLFQSGSIPTEEQVSLHKGAFSLLKNTLLGEHVQTIGNGEGAIAYSSITREVSLVIVPVGSFGLDVWDVNSDIDCLCVGSSSVNTFFSLARQRLRRAADQGIKILRADKAGSGTMFEIEIHGIKLDLQYCQARVGELWSQLHSLSPTDPMLQIPVLSLKRLNAYRDAVYVMRTTPDLKSFRLAHRTIKLWARERGLYPSRFGYLGGHHITLMLSRVCKMVSREAGTTSAADIVRTFFAYFAAFDFTTERILDQEFHHTKPRYQRSAREPMVVLSIHSPVINVGYMTSPDTLRTIISELKRAVDLFSEDNITWSRLMGIHQDSEEIGTQSSGVMDFVQDFKTFAKIDIHYWGPSIAKGGRLVEWIETKCPSFINVIDHKLPDLHTRIWPSRFTVANINDNTNNNQVSGDDYRAFYLIGLAKSDETSQPTFTAERRRTAQAALRATIQAFADELRTNDRYDRTTSWIDVTLIKQADLGAIQLDVKNWGHVEDEERRDFLLDDDYDDEVTAAESDENTETSPSKKCKHPNKAPSSKDTNIPSITAVSKLRPASDILHRLRWDASIDSANFLVGYDDRFVGAKEMPLEWWKMESSEEEFIPQHRILYFRRKSDGVVVWERGRKIDRVFGSGVGGSDL